MMAERSSSRSLSIRHLTASPSSMKVSPRPLKSILSPLTRPPARTRWTPRHWVPANCPRQRTIRFTPRLSICSRVARPARLPDGVKCGWDGPGRPAEHLFLEFPGRFLMLSLLGVALIGAAGCQRKFAPLTTAGIRGITRELAFAVHNASGGRAEVGMRPEYAPRQPGKPQTLVADRIYITVPLSH